MQDLVKTFIRQSQGLDSFQLSLKAEKTYKDLYSLYINENKNSDNRYSLEKSYTAIRDFGLFLSNGVIPPSTSKEQMKEFAPLLKHLAESDTYVQKLLMNIES